MLFLNHTYHRQKVQHNGFFYLKSVHLPEFKRQHDVFEIFNYYVDFYRHRIRLTFSIEMCFIFNTIYLFQIPPNVLFFALAFQHAYYDFFSLYLSL
jgi:hypothetical protein